MTYSQYNDEGIINGVFGDFVGRFLDIGAFDGENMSNTRALALKGWGGVLVEPSPWVFPKLYELYKNDYPRIVLINAAVSWSFALMKLWPDTTDHKYGSTLSGEWAEKSHISGAHPYWVKPLDIASLVEKCGALDFVKIDTEGHDSEIVLAADTWGGAKLLCFEHSTLQQDMLDAVLERLSNRGFGFHANTPTNTYLLRI